MSELDFFIPKIRQHSTYDVSTSNVERPIFNFSWRIRMYGTSPNPAEPLVTIFRLRPGDEKSFCIIGAGVVSIETHYHGSTRLCAGDGCAWCLEGFEKQWRGYIAAVATGSIQGIIEITAGSFEEWQGLLAAGELYSKIIKVNRPSRYGSVRPIISTAINGPVWPIVDNDTVFDKLCRILRLPRRGAHIDRDSWLAAVRGAAQAGAPSPTLKAHIG
jgi:hypothetical protein